ncbi:hypothetical protein QOZ43_29290, partial [Pseudomonas aeruginosa]|uniref:hypothetical protein n=1 Tax=Pseudomonas aeruginosa TaxID=287 RepID=UPI00345AA208
QRTALRRVRCSCAQPHVSWTLRSVPASLTHNRTCPSVVFFQSRASPGEISAAVGFAALSVIAETRRIAPYVDCIQE